VTKLTHGCS
jgi:hypothetical protein